MNKQDLLKIKQYLLDNGSLLEAFSLLDYDDIVYDALDIFVTQNKLNRYLAYGNIARFCRSTTVEIQLKFIDFLIKYNDLILFI